MRPELSAPSCAPTFRRQEPDRRNTASRERLLGRVRAEFGELRALKLTLRQAERLFNVREDICRRIMNTLIAEGLLRTTDDGSYARRS